MAQAWTSVVTGQERLLNRDRTPRGATTVLALVRIELEATREVEILDSSPTREPGENKASDDERRDKRREKTGGIRLI